MIHEKPVLGQRIIQNSSLPKIDIEKDKPRKLPDTLTPTLSRQGGGRIG
jgi:hypothetical protein